MRDCIAITKNRTGSWTLTSFYISTSITCAKYSIDLKTLHLKVTYLWHNSLYHNYEDRMKTIIYIRNFYSSLLLRTYVLLYLTIKTPWLLWLQDFIFFLSSIFVYEPILIKTNSMNANIMKTQIFHWMKYYEGHIRSS